MDPGSSNKKSTWAPRTLLDLPELILEHNENMFATFWRPRLCLQPLGHILAWVGIPCPVGGFRKSLCSNDYAHCLFSNWFTSKRHNIQGYIWGPCLTVFVHALITRIICLRPLSFKTIDVPLIDYAFYYAYDWCCMDLPWLFCGCTMDLLWISCCYKFTMDLV